MRRSKYLKSKQKKHKAASFKWLYYLLGILLISILSFIFYKVLTLEKFQFVNNREDNVEIIIFDSKRDDVTKIFIDKDFYVDASRNLGEYKLGNLWVLGKKEKYQGKLVAETVTKNFGTPVFLWKDDSSTNLNIFQRIKVLFLKVENKEYDFTLTSKNVKDSVLVNFVHPATIDHLPKIRINDLTGDKDMINSFSKTLEVLGFKIVDYSKGFDEYVDCEVVGKSSVYLSIFNELFDCRVNVDKSQSIDLDIRIGKVFSDRF